MTCCAEAAGRAFVDLPPRKALPSVLPGKGGTRMHPEPWSNLPLHPGVLPAVP